MIVFLAEIVVYTINSKTKIKRIWLSDRRKLLKVKFSFVKHRFTFRSAKDTFVFSPQDSNHRPAWLRKIWICMNIRQYLLTRYVQRTWQTASYLTRRRSLPDIFSQSEIPARRHSREKRCIFQSPTTSVRMK